MKQCSKCKIKFEPRKRNGIIISKLCPDCKKEKEYQDKIKQSKKKKKLREVVRKIKKREKKKNSVSVLTTKADTLFSKAVRLRDGRCRRTGGTENLQCSHIWGRSNKLIRWDLDNALTLTAGQHLYWWHTEPAEAIEWAKELLGDEKWEELKQKKNQYFKLTPEFIKERIQFLEEYITTYE